ncbi:uncharacterized protein LOC126295266 [Schistocerca gregaria]|uniref:uncharacterized protein LOC126295266 n=1 Tax=Schistocerca gregaria TaxID=7010 RepID=UPI00211F17A3|nr:uncharacterized protein LOC126295266 [Schistocerca gregaria]
MDMYSMATISSATLTAPLNCSHEAATAPSVALPVYDDEVGLRGLPDRGPDDRPERELCPGDSAHLSHLDRLAIGRLQEVAASRPASTSVSGSSSTGRLRPAYCTEPAERECRELSSDLNSEGPVLPHGSVGGVGKSEWYPYACYYCECRFKFVSARSMHIVDVHTNLIVSSGPNEAEPEHRPGDAFGGEDSDRSPGINFDTPKEILAHQKVGHPWPEPLAEGLSLSESEWEPQFPQALASGMEKGSGPAFCLPQGQTDTLSSPKREIEAIFVNEESPFLQECELPDGPDSARDPLSFEEESEALADDTHSTSNLQSIKKEVQEDLLPVSGCSGFIKEEPDLYVGVDSTENEEASTREDASDITRTGPADLGLPHSDDSRSVVDVPASDMMTSTGDAATLASESGGTPAGVGSTAHADSGGATFGVVASGVDEERCSGDAGSSGTRPPFSYAELIAMAIVQSPHRRAMLSEIYSYVASRFPYYAARKKFLQKMISNNVARYSCFVKLPQEGGKLKRHYWMLDPQYEHMFESGKFRPRRRVKRPLNSDSVSEGHVNGVHSHNGEHRLDRHNPCRLQHRTGTSEHLQLLENATESLLGHSVLRAAAESGLVRGDTLSPPAYPHYPSTATPPEVGNRDKAAPNSSHPGSGHSEDATLASDKTVSAGDTTIPASTSDVTVNDSGGGTGIGSVGTTAGCAGREVGEEQRPSDTGSAITASTKPPFSYTELIAMAIEHSPHRRALLPQIHAYISSHFPYYGPNQKGWQMAIKNRLSSSKCFVKVPQEVDRRKGNYWMVDPQYEDLLKKGNFRLHRSVGMVTTANATYGPDSTYQSYLAHCQQHHAAILSPSAPSALRAATDTGDGSIRDEGGSVGGGSLLPTAYSSLPSGDYRTAIPTSTSLSCSKVGSTGRAAPNSSHPGDSHCEEDIPVSDGTTSPDDTAVLTSTSWGTDNGANEEQCLSVAGSARTAKKRPLFSYTELSAMAIAQSPNRRARVSEIYAYIVKRFPYFKRKKKMRQKALSNNLSRNRCFIKVPQRDGTGKGNYWMLDPKYEEKLENGEFRPRDMKQLFHRGLGVSVPVRRVHFDRGLRQRHRTGLSEDAQLPETGEGATVPLPSDLPYTRNSDASTTPTGVSASEVGSTARCAPGSSHPGAGRRENDISAADKTLSVVDVGTATSASDVTADSNGGGARGAGEERLLGDTDTARTADVRPPYSYKMLIAMAIAQSPHRRSTMSEIYAYISNRYPYFRHKKKMCQNSIRCILSSYKCFVRVPPESGDRNGAYSNYWMLDPQHGDMLENRICRSRNLKRPFHRGSAASVPLRHSQLRPDQPHRHTGVSEQPELLETGGSTIPLPTYPHYTRCTQISDENDNVSFEESNLHNVTHDEFVMPQEVSTHFGSYCVPAQGITTQEDNFLCSTDNTDPLADNRLIICNPRSIKKEVFDECVPEFSGCNEEDPEVYLGVDSTEIEEADTRGHTSDITRKVTLSEIYAYVSSHFPYLEQEKESWQKSIRVSLSFSKYFVKVPREDGDGQGRSCDCWTLDPQHGNTFDYGNFFQQQCVEQPFSRSRSTEAGDVAVGSGATSSRNYPHRARYEHSAATATSASLSASEIDSTDRAAPDSSHPGGISREDDIPVSDVKTSTDGAATLISPCGDTGNDRRESAVGSSANGAGEEQPSGDTGSASAAVRKPPFQYEELIAMAIMKSPHRRATLSEINAYIANCFPYFDRNKKSWKSSIHCKLCFSKYFIKVPLGGRNYKGKRFNCWMLDPQYEDMFERGNFCRQQHAKRPSSRSRGSEGAGVGVGGGGASPSGHPHCARREHSTATTTSATVVISDVYGTVRFAADSSRPGGGHREDDIPVSDTVTSTGGAAVLTPATADTGNSRTDDTDANGVVGEQPSGDTGSAGAAGRKPPYCYEELIAMAILKSSRRRATLKEIVTYIASRFPFFKRSEKSWQSSVQCKLYFSKYFLKVPLAVRNRKGKRCNLWLLDPQYENMFERGNFRQHRRSKRPSYRSRGNGAADTDVGGGAVSSSAFLHHSRSIPISDRNDSASFEESKLQNVTHDEVATEQETSAHIINSSVPTQGIISREDNHFHSADNTDSFPDDPLPICDLQTIKKEVAEDVLAVLNFSGYVKEEPELDIGVDVTENEEADTRGHFPDISWYTTPTSTSQPASEVGRNIWSAPDLPHSGGDLCEPDTAASCVAAAVCGVGTLTPAPGVTADRSGDGGTGTDSERVATGSGADGAGEEPLLGDGGAASSDDTRPPYSYRTLISMAIAQSPLRKVTRSEIYAYIVGRFPYLKLKGKIVQHSLSCTLSSSKCFVKVPREADGRGIYWTLDPRYDNTSENGKFQHLDTERPFRQVLSAAVPALRVLQAADATATAVGGSGATLLPANLPYTSAGQAAPESSQPGDGRCENDTPVSSDATSAGDTAVLTSDSSGTADGGETAAGRAADGISEEQCSSVAGSASTAKKKPLFSYTELGAMAIAQSPHRRAKLYEIFAYVMRRFPYFRRNQKIWQKALSTTLSRNKCFINVRQEAGKLKGSYWMFDPQYEDMLKNGKFSLWHRRRPFHSGPTASVSARQAHTLRGRHRHRGLRPQRQQHVTGLSEQPELPETGGSGGRGGSVLLPTYPPCTSTTTQISADLVASEAGSGDPSETDSTPTSADRSGDGTGTAGEGTAVDGGAVGAGEGQCSGNASSARTARKRPQFSYTELSAMAIAQSPHRRAKLSEMYAYVTSRFPYYRRRKFWQKAFSNNLSRSKCFVNVPLEGDKQKGNYWMLDPKYEAVLEKGNFRHRHEERPFLGSPAVSVPLHRQRHSTSLAEHPQVPQSGGCGVGGAAVPPFSSYPHYTRPAQICDGSDSASFEESSLPNVTRNELLMAQEMSTHFISGTDPTRDSASFEESSLQNVTRNELVTAREMPTHFISCSAPTLGIITREDNSFCSTDNIDRLSDDPHPICDLQNVKVEVVEDPLTVPWFNGCFKEDPDAYLGVNATESEEEARGRHAPDVTRESTDALTSSGLSVTKVGSTVPTAPDSSYPGDSHGSGHDATPWTSNRGTPTFASCDNPNNSGDCTDFDSREIGTGSVAGGAAEKRRLGNTGSASAAKTEPQFSYKSAVANAVAQSPHSTATTTSTGLIVSDADGTVRAAPDSPRPGSSHFEGSVPVSGATVPTDCAGTVNSPSGVTGNGCVDSASSDGRGSSAGCPAGGAGETRSSDDTGLASIPHSKPPFQYEELIAMAILKSPRRPTIREHVQEWQLTAIPAPETALLTASEYRGQRRRRWSSCCAIPYAPHTLPAMNTAPIRPPTTHPDLVTATAGTTLRRQTRRRQLRATQPLRPSPAVAVISTVGKPSRGAAADGAGAERHPSVAGTAEKKPPFSYTELSAMAIADSPHRRAKLSEIFAYVTSRFPYYELGKEVWQRAFSVNLSRSKCFVNVSHGGSTYWMLNRQYEDIMEMGRLRRQHVKRTFFGGPTAAVAARRVPTRRSLRKHRTWRRHTGLSEEQQRLPESEAGGSGAGAAGSGTEPPPAPPHCTRSTQLSNGNNSASFEESNLKNVTHDESMMARETLTHFVSCRVPTQGITTEENNSFCSTNNSEALAGGPLTVGDPQSIKKEVFEDPLAVSAFSRCIKEDPDLHFAADATDNEEEATRGHASDVTRAATPTPTGPSVNDVVGTGPAAPDTSLRSSGHSEDDVPLRDVTASTAGAGTRAFTSSGTAGSSDGGADTCVGRTAGCGAAGGARLRGAGSVSTAESKPQFSYKDTIAAAIAQSPHRRLTVPEIYTYITSRFPYFRDKKKIWRNSVRWCLWYHKCFVKVPLEGGDDKARCCNYWTLDPQYGDVSENGRFHHRREEHPFLRTPATSVTVRRYHTRCSLRRHLQRRHTGLSERLQLPETATGTATLSVSLPVSDIGSTGEAASVSSRPGDSCCEGDTPVSDVTVSPGGATTPTPVSGGDGTDGTGRGTAVGSAAGGAREDRHCGGAGSAWTARKRPPHSYTELSAMAIAQSPNRRAKLSEIHDYIMSHFPYFTRRKKIWQKALSTILSHKKCFVNVPQKGGNYWMLDPEYEEMLEKGKLRRRGKKRPFRKGPGVSVPAHRVPTGHSRRLPGSRQPLRQGLRTGLAEHPQLPDTAVGSPVGPSKLRVAAGGEGGDGGGAVPLPTYLHYERYEKKSTQISDGNGSTSLEESNLQNGTHDEFVMEHETSTHFISCSVLTQGVISQEDNSFCSSDNVQTDAFADDPLTICDTRSIKREVFEDPLAVTGFGGCIKEEPDLCYGEGATDSRETATRGHASDITRTAGSTPNGPSKSEVGSTVRAAGDSSLLSGGHCEYDTVASGVTVSTGDAGTLTSASCGISDCGGGGKTYTESGRTGTGRAAGKGGEKRHLCGTDSGSPATTKPQLTHKALIASAIAQSPYRKLTLSEIYDNIASRFPYFRRNRKIWLHAISCCLWYNKCFVKVPQEGGDDKAKCCNYWTLDPRYEDVLENDRSCDRRTKRPRRGGPAPTVPTQRASSHRDRYRHVADDPCQGQHRCGPSNRLRLPENATGSLSEPSARTADPSGGGGSGVGSSAFGGGIEPVSTYPHYSNTSVPTSGGLSVSGDDDAVRPAYEPPLPGESGCCEDGASAPDAVTSTGGAATLTSPSGGTGDGGRGTAVGSAAGEERTSGAAASASRKPAFSYEELIAMAIMKSPHRRARMTEINTYIASRFPYFERNEKSWQHSIHCKLCFSKYFVKMPLRSSKYRGRFYNYWMLDPQYEDVFENGNFQRQQHTKRPFSWSRGIRSRARGSGVHAVPSSAALHSTRYEHSTSRATRDPSRPGTGRREGDVPTSYATASAVGAPTPAVRFGDAADTVGGGSVADIGTAAGDGASDAAGDTGSPCTAAVKPPFSYTELNAMAIMHSPHRRATLSEIYTYVTSRFPYCKRNKKFWQRALSNNLSRNECFVYAPQEGAEQKGSCWKLEPQYEDAFENGKFRHRLGARHRRHWQ